MSAGAACACSNASCIAAITPRPGLSGVVRVLAVNSRWLLASASTTSVKVPPISTPMKYFCPAIRLRAPPRSHVRQRMALRPALPASSCGPPDCLASSEFSGGRRVYFEADRVDDHRVVARRRLDRYHSLRDIAGDQFRVTLP